MSRPAGISPAVSMSTRPSWPSNSSERTCGMPEMRSFRRASRTAGSPRPTALISLTVASSSRLTDASDRAVCSASKAVRLEKLRNASCSTRARSVRTVHSAEAMLMPTSSAPNANSAPRSEIGERVAAARSSAPGRWMAVTTSAGRAAGLRFRRPLVQHLYSDVENVTRAALGVDVTGTARIGFELLAQAHDLHVDGTVVHAIGVEPGEIQQLVAAKGAARGTEQDNEQVEVALAQRDRAPTGRDEPARMEIELPAVEAIGADSAGAALPHFDTIPAKHASDAREQLARGERLRKVVIGAELQAHHPVGLVASRGEHDDRDCRVLAQPAREAHAVLGLQSQIEQNEVDDLLLEHFAHRATVGDGGDSDVVAPKVIDDQRSNRGVIVHGENVRRQFRTLLGARPRLALEPHKTLLSNESTLRSAESKRICTARLDPNPSGLVPVGIRAKAGTPE